MIKEFILNKILESGLKQSKKYLLEKNYTLATEKNQIEESINIHLKKIKNWAGEISFKDSKHAKQINEVFIHLDLTLIPRREKLTQSNISKVNIDDIPKEQHNILLGEPGAGKTTTLKYLCHNLLFSESEVYDNCTYPLVLKLRDCHYFNSDTFIFDEIRDIYGFNLTQKNDNHPNKKVPENILTQYLLNFLDTQQLVLILDGLDELPSVKAKENAISNLRTLTSTLDQSFIIATSRTSDFNIHIENANQYEFTPLNKDQVKKFTIKWLGDTKEGNLLYKKIIESPFSDTAIRPLTIAHLCAIYERLGDIPKKPKTVYKKIVHLMLEEWDQQRSIKRVSKYSKFEIDRKFEFLSALAFKLTTELNKYTFNSTHLEKIYKTISSDFNLPYNEYQEVINELETHTGLIIKSGFDNYEFAHKSIQEYLTAAYIVKLPEIPTQVEILEKIPNEMAIAVTISSNPSIYLTQLIETRIKNKLSVNFIFNFANRLILEKPEINPKTNVIFSLLYIYRKVLDAQDVKKVVARSNKLGNFNSMISDLIRNNKYFLNEVNRSYRRVKVSNKYSSMSAKVSRFEKKEGFDGPRFIILPEKAINV